MTGRSAGGRVGLPVLLLALLALACPAVSEGREADTDRDGLTDGYELAVARTEPQTPDTDADGTSDGTEVMFGADPLVRPRSTNELLDQPLPPVLPLRDRPPDTSIEPAPLAPARAGPADVHLAPSGSDGGACARATPCRSFARAYAVAAAGDVVLVAPGWYPPQSVPSGSKTVTFRGEPGVRVRQLISDASNVVFDGIEVDAGGVKPSWAALELHGSGATFMNAAVGNVVDEKGLLVTGANHTIDNVDFHDVVLKTPGIHLECMYAIGVPGLTVRNSTFHDCAVMDLFLTYGDWWTPQPPAYGNVTLENNVFGHPEQLENEGWHTCCGLYVGNLGPGGARDPMIGWTVRNNTFEQTAFVTPERGAGDTRWVGNVGDWECRPGVSYSHNVGMKCSATDQPVVPASSSPTVRPPYGWVDPAAGDFRLEAGSPAIGAADPDDFPVSDRYGFLRSDRPDAGAHEHD